jgi:hypothetical protein
MAARRKPKARLDRALGEVAKEIEHGTSFELRAQPRRRAPAKPRASGRSRAPREGETAFDYRALRPLVREAARAAFAALRSRRGKERLYAFALHVTAGGAILPSANSEERLARAGGAGRWLPLGWAYHGQGAQHFAEVQGQLAAGPDPAVLTVPARERHLARLLAMCSAALAELDDEGFFGRGPDRERVVLLVTLEDAAPELLAQIARQINPAAAAARLLAGEPRRRPPRRRPPAR